ncbi:MAG: fluoride efflux transporter CrcB [Chthoniobacterales bacterium]
MLALKQSLIVAFGGALGSLARFKLGGVVLHHSQGWNFPASTFSVNVLGCLIIGLLAGLAEYHDLMSPSLRLLLFTGVLGGFTTFSALGYETVFLLRRGLFAVAIGYVVLSVLFGLLAVGGGMKLVDLLWRARH